MKRQIFRCLVATMMATAGSESYTIANAAAQANAPEGIVIDVRADKRPYVLGDPLELDIEVMNRSAATIQMPGQIDVWVGNIEVFVTDASGEYKQYRGPGWGLRDVADAGTQTLRSGRAANTSATLLYNHGSRVDHLNAAAQAKLGGRLAEGFAFTRAGIYSVVVVYRGGDRMADVVSEPVQIVMTEPKGDDLQVWNRLRVDPETAYFLHTASAKGHPASDKALALVDTLEALVNLHPASHYADAIRTSLAKHRAETEQLKERGLIAR